jgi:cyclophilin family peptidyl-prolyl cis-trans isomerase
MIARPGLTALLVCALAAPISAQVVRFETTVGSFDMVLNPTNNAQLQGHVDNMLRYVENGNYNGSWINRAAELQSGGEFVLQMGGFFSHTLRPPMTIESTRPVAAFAPITGAPRIQGLSNTPGTVSLALSGSNPNSGSSSFFVNLADNNFLDEQFTVFAAISDLTVVNQIMTLTDLDLTDPARVPPFTGDEVTFGNVPVQANGHQVFIKRAFVVRDAISVAQATAAIQSTMELSAATAASGESAALANSSVGLAGESSLPQLATAALPEPASLLTALFGLSYILLCCRGRRK